MIVFANGQAASLLEHSPIDGHTGLRLFTDYGKNLASDPVATSAAEQGKAKVKELKWNIDETIISGIAKAKQEANEWISKTSGTVLEKDFGKKKIVSNKMSPDGMVQMSYQLAYYKLYRKFDSTYESCNTKNFIGGRTETIRSVTNESVAFVNAWVDPSVEKEKKVMLYRSRSLIWISFLILICLLWL